MHNSNDFSVWNSAGRWIRLEAAHVGSLNGDAWAYFVDLKERVAANLKFFVSITHLQVDSDVMLRYLVTSSIPSNMKLPSPLPSWAAIPPNSFPIVVSICGGVVLYHAVFDWLACEA